MSRVSSSSIQIALLAVAFLALHVQFLGAVRAVKLGVATKKMDPASRGAHGHAYGFGFGFPPGGNPIAGGSGFEAYQVSQVDGDSSRPFAGSSSGSDAASVGNGAGLSEEALDLQHQQEYEYDVNVTHASYAYAVPATAPVSVTHASYAYAAPAYAPAAGA